MWHICSFDAVCDMVICDDRLITHELAVEFAEDGSFRYLSNKIKIIGNVIREIGLETDKRLGYQGKEGMPGKATPLFLREASQCILHVHLTYLPGLFQKVSKSKNFLGIFHSLSLHLPSQIGSHDMGKIADVSDISEILAIYLFLRRQILAAACKNP